MFPIKNWISVVSIPIYGFETFPSYPLDHQAS